MMDLIAHNQPTTPRGTVSFSQQIRPVPQNNPENLDSYT